MILQLKCCQPGVYLSWSVLECWKLLWKVQGITIHALCTTHHLPIGREPHHQTQRDVQQRRYCNDVVQKLNTLAEFVHNNDFTARRVQIIRNGITKCGADNLTTDAPLEYLVLLSRGVGVCLWAPGGCPGASTSAVRALGCPSCFGPGLVRAVLGHWSHVVGLGGAALCVMGTGRMQVLWSGRCVAGCGSYRRVQLVAVVRCCWPALGG